MTSDEALALFPEGNEKQINKNAVASAEGPPKYGVAQLSYRPSSQISSSTERFAGIEQIYVTLFDGHVVDFSVTYAGPNSYGRGPAWDSIDDFITKLSESLGLPERKYWLAKGPYRVVKCGAFEVEATNLNRQGSIRLRSNGYEETVRQRAAAEEERLRRLFKP